MLPALLFVAQLERPPRGVLKLEEEALRRVAPGPGAWCSLADLHHGPELGLSRRLRPMEITCTASMLRVHYWENRANGGIRWKRMGEAHRRQRAATVHLVRAVVMRPWLDGHIATVVNEVAATRE